MQLFEIGIFDCVGFKWLYVVGYFEGNCDIDFDGSEKNVMEVFYWKQKFSDSIDVEMVLVIQFCFEVKLVIVWVDVLWDVGVILFIYIGVVGLVKL